jgi:hypothetical protein
MSRSLNCGWKTARDGKFVCVIMEEDISEKEEGYRPTAEFS